MWGLKGNALKALLRLELLPRGDCELVFTRWQWGWRMSNVFMQEVLRISDRYLSDSGSGYFKQVMVLVLIFHMIMGACFLRMQEYEKAHPRPAYNVDVSFLAAELPRSFDLEKSIEPPPISITDGDNPNPGGEKGSKAHNDKLSVVSFKEKQEADEQKQHSAQTLDPISETRQGPVSINTFKQSKVDISNRNAKSQGSISDGSTTQQNAGGSFVKGGSPLTDGSSNGEFLTGNGESGNGTGPSNAGNGGESGNQGDKLQISRNVETVRGGMGNISPYRMEVLKNLTRSWHPTRKMRDSVTILFQIGRDGTPFDAQVVSSCGNEKMDAEAIAAAEKTTFPPLPDWYKGEALTFQIDMGQSVQFQQ